MLEHAEFAAYNVPMPATPGEPSDVSPAPLSSGYSTSTLAAVAISSVAVGIGIAWALYAHFDSLSVEKILEWAGLALIIGLVTLALAIPLTLLIIRRLLRRIEGSLSVVVQRSSQTARAYLEGRPTDAFAHAEVLVQEGIAWYAPIAARRFVVQSTLALLVAVGGLVGTTLLFRQNSLLKEQNEKLDKQNEKTDFQIITAEAQRRADLTAELFAILRQVEDLTSQSGARYELSKVCVNRYAADDPIRNPNMVDGCASDAKKMLVLPPGLTGRIRALAASATPHFTVQISRGESWVFSTSGKPLSRQRGQLLIGLAASGVDFAKLGADFRYADVSDANLDDANLSGIRADGANFSGSTLERAILKNASLRDVNFYRAKLIGTDARDSSLSNADFSSSKLDFVDFGGSTLENVGFYSAFIRSVRFSEANLFRTSFLNADLANVTISESNIVSNRSRPGVGIFRRFIVTDLHRARSLSGVKLPDGWNIESESYEAPIPNFGSPKSVILHNISTPWGNYEGLVKKQLEDANFDLDKLPRIDQRAK